ncbi:PDZ domain-containing protein [Salisediminibacterium beveridgei]|uniref:PDZ domain-containing protein n=1 Tax=Salisediminibacterium beveridgei TaxID=632773 RepID=A0A1D7QSJ3_9BACI|nr:PDZ domain-containing protein [Salisediminibacterium beveridgei]AOM81951.1 hypothetical protein BBEV_0558 [Salisediminibacterium beveridgei]
MQDAGLELIYGAGRFLMHPYTYLFIVIAMFGAWRIVKRQRQDFHTRLFKISEQVTHPLPAALLAGLLVSVVLVGVGVTIPAGVIALLAVIWLPFLLFGNPRWMSATIAGGLTLLVLPWIPGGGTGVTFVDDWLGQAAAFDPWHLAVLISVLFFAEALLVKVDGHRMSSPRVVTSSRGKKVGEHLARRLWFMPVVVLFPLGSLALTDYWPLAQDAMSVSAFGFVIIPVMLGHHLRVHGEYVKAGTKKAANRLVFLAVVSLGIATGAFWMEELIWLLPILLIIGRLLIFIAYEAADKRKLSMFSRREDGLKILGILPGSIAEKMGVEIGEVIVKVNKRPVASQREFYDALQTNPAYCKLEVLDEDGELRITQASVTHKDHYLRGFMFVPDDEFGNLSYRALRSAAVIGSDRSSIETQLSKETEPAALPPKMLQNTQAGYAGPGIYDDSSVVYLKDIQPLIEKKANPEMPVEIERNEVLVHDEARAEEASQRTEHVEKPDEQTTFKSGGAYGQAAGLSEFYKEFKEMNRQEPSVKRRRSDGGDQEE